MATGPGLFTDIGKKAKDLLTREYVSDQKLSISTYSDAGVFPGFLYQQLERAVGTYINCSEERGLSSGDVAAQYKYKNTLVDVKFDTESNIATTLTFTDIVPSTKTIASIRLPDFNSGKGKQTEPYSALFLLQLEVQYFHPHATFTIASVLNQSPTVDISTTIGSPTFALGAETGYENTSGKFTKYTVGISVTKPDSCASVILGDKGDTIRASYIHHIDQLKKTAGVAEITRRFSTNENTFTVGGAYAVDNLTLVKAKLNNHGNLGAVLQHEVIPKSLLTISSEFDTKALEKTPRFGLALALKR